MIRGSPSRKLLDNLGFIAISSSSTNLDAGNSVGTTNRDGRPIT